MAGWTSACGVRPSGPPGLLLSLLVLFAVIPWPAAAGNCEFAKILEFPITMSNLRPYMTAKINDTDVDFMVDSGAFYSAISAANASQLGLATYHASREFFVSGVGGGHTDASIARVNVFTLGEAALRNTEFVVLDGRVLGRVGLLGQDVLHIGDVEYDFAHRVVRLMKAKDCKKALLAYWVGTTQPYSVIDIERTSARQPHTVGDAFIGGVKIRVLFDTGAGPSTLSLAAAARAGIKPDSPGVVAGGPVMGLGNATVPSYVAPVSSFKIGDEEVRNTKLRIANLAFPNADMLIGPDFFLSHRVYVANGQRKLYFTYNGGPVFNLSHLQSASSDDDAATPSAEAQVPDASKADSQPAASLPDAAEYGRRATALASRNDFSGALVALGLAIDLEPLNAQYFYARGGVYLQMNAPESALHDFDQAVKLRPDYLAALLARSEMLLRKNDKPGAVADLNAADAATPKQADARFSMAYAYERAGDYGSAITQMNLWLGSHPSDARVSAALNTRCWDRALLNVDLPLALKDCNNALRHLVVGNTFHARVYKSLGLLLFRMGQYDESITDYNETLKIEHRDAWALYGRGVDEYRLRKSADGQADMDQAAVFATDIAEEFKRHGIAP